MPAHSIPGFLQVILWNNTLCCFGVWQKNNKQRTMLRKLIYMIDIMLDVGPNTVEMNG